MAGRERRAAMSGGHAHHDGWLAGRDESNPMPKKNFTNVELLGRAFRDQAHLMFGHGAMCFVLDAFNLAVIFRPANGAPENDYGT